MCPVNAMSLSSILGHSCILDKHCSYEVKLNVDNGLFARKRWRATFVAYIFSLALSICFGLRRRQFRKFDNNKSTHKKNPPYLHWQNAFRRHSTNVRLPLNRKQQIQLSYLFLASDYIHSNVCMYICMTMNSPLAILLCVHIIMNAHTFCSWSGKTLWHVSCAYPSHRIQCVWLMHDEFSDRCVCMCVSGVSMFIRLAYLFLFGGRFYLIYSLVPSIRPCLYMGECMHTYECRVKLLICVIAWLIIVIYQNYWNLKQQQKKKLKNENTSKMEIGLWLRCDSLFHILQIVVCALEAVQRTLCEV